MAPTLATRWRAFWHTMTSNDRHASHDSPYRTGNQYSLSRPSSFSAAAGSAALGSTADVDIEAGGNFVPGSGSPLYSPEGRRMSPQRQGPGLNSTLESAQVEGIQMHSFSDGLPPPPPAEHSWKRIERWLEDNYEELFENLGGPATVNDVNELEHDLDCTLPNEVRESIQIHDGQERGGLPTGIIFGCMLLDCEEIVQEWQNWRTVNDAYLDEPRGFPIQTAPSKAFAGSSQDASEPESGSPQWRSELLDRQDSQPPNAIQKVYTHPAWIPLARDWGGNNIAVDLAPGPAGRWGQVILIGRDYDCKYVISRSWSAFLASLADDMNTDKWFIDEDTKELKLREFKKQGVEPAYIDILRWRSDQKYGRRPPKKRPLRVNPNAPPAPNGHSPYNSPSTDDRGRSPHRFANGKAAAGSSPRGHVSSPLARVTEEISPTQNSQHPQQLSLDTDLSALRGGSSADKLISGIDSPQPLQSPKADSRVGGIDAQRRESDKGHRASVPFVKSPLSSQVLASADDDGSQFPLLAQSSAENRSAAGGDANDGMRDVPI